MTRVAGSASTSVVFDAPKMVWGLAGADFKRHAAKWRCPTGECQPKGKWVKGSRRNPLIPRESKRFRSLYKGGASIEREWATQERVRACADTGARA